MLIQYQSRLIFLLLISLSMMMCEDSSAAALTVKLVVNPNRTEVSAGSDRIVLTTRASGTRLTFKWELRGPGKLEEKGPAAFYFPPEVIEKASELATITVTVTDDTGQKVKETVTFKVLARSTPTSSPVPTPTVTTGMSRGIKETLGIGVVAILVGGTGIALMIAFAFKRLFKEWREEKKKKRGWFRRKSGEPEEVQSETGAQATPGSATVEAPPDIDLEFPVEEPEQLYALILHQYSSSREDDLIRLIQQVGQVPEERARRLLKVPALIKQGVSTQAAHIAIEKFNQVQAQMKLITMEKLEDLQKKQQHATQSVPNPPPSPQGTSGVDSGECYALILRKFDPSQRKPVLELLSSLSNTPVTQLQQTLKTPALVLRDASKDEVTMIAQQFQAIQGDVKMLTMPELQKLMTRKTVDITGLRNKPLTVSDEEAQKVFGVDNNWRPHEYIKNDFEDRGDVVVDHATGLIWQKSGSDTYLKYEDAQAYIDRLNRERFAEYDDWRLPTIEELLSLSEPEKQLNGLYINPLFDAQQKCCWSSDRRSAAAAWGVSAWSVGFLHLGDVDWHNLDYQGGVRCVRSRQC